MTNTISTRVLQPGQSEGLKTMLIVSGHKRIRQNVFLEPIFPPTLSVLKNKVINCNIKEFAEKV